MSMSTPQALGILGGTFDPIHFGHLRMAVELHTALRLSKVHVLPCYQPVHRDAPFASSEHRWAMVQRAIASEPALYADDREIKRKQPSYTIDTLQAFREEMPNTPLCLLLGSDAFLGFLNWHRPLDILKLVHLIVAERPSFQLPTSGPLADLLKQHRQKDTAFIHEQKAGGIIFQGITALDISASSIRSQIALQNNVRYLLPDSVYDYIQCHDIYRRV